MWAVLFLLGCTIDSIGCTIFDENHASEYEDFHDDSYSEDDDYEDEYSDPVTTEAPRVRRYDRMTHTVPTPAPTIGLPEVKDALQMLMLGRNLSASDKKDLEAGSKFIYPIDENFDDTMSIDAISPRPTEELEIPIEFFEMKVSTKTMSTSEPPIEFYDITMATETTSNRWTPIEFFDVQMSTEIMFTGETPIEFYDVKMSTKTMFTGETPIEFYDVKMSTETMFTGETPIEFYDFKMSTETMTTSEKPTRSRDHPMEPPRTYFQEQPNTVGFTDHTMEPPRTYFQEQPTTVSFTDHTMEPPRTYFKEQLTTVGLTEHTIEPTRTYFKEQPTIVGLTEHTIEPTRTYFKEQPTTVGFTEHITANQITIQMSNNNTTVDKPTRVDFMDIGNAMQVPFDTKDINAIWNRSHFFKNSAQEELFTIDKSIINNVMESTELTEETPQNQTAYFYEHSKSSTDAYIDSKEIYLLRTGPAALPVTRTNAVFQTVFLYENERPEYEVILREDDDGSDDEDDDGVVVSGNWSDEYEPLEFLLTDNLRSGLRKPVDQVSTEANTIDDSSGNSTDDTGTGTQTTATTTKKKKSKKPKVKTTTPYPFDVEKFLELVANLTYDYYTNLTEELNMTLIRLGAPTCPTPTTLTTTTSTQATRSPRPDYSIMENKIMGKCYVCGLVDEGIPWNAHCSDAFAGDFLPLSPVDARAKGWLSKFRKYCRYDDVDHYVSNITMPRTIFGRWTGGCGVRWTDISGIYTQRTCRNRNHPTTGKHYASKRMSKLEMALANTENGCIVSPVASLIPLSRGISLYARFHACVCTGSWCNVSSRVDSDVWKAYVIVGLLLVLR